MWRYRVSFGLGVAFAVAAGWLNGGDESPAFAVTLFGLSLVAFTAAYVDRRRRQREAKALSQKSDEHGTVHRSPPG